MKATGIVRRIDDLGRVVIPKEIRRTMRIREGDPLLTTLTQIDLLRLNLTSICKRKLEIEKKKRTRRTT
jgi:AbrB family looped-hinge helix DNA binding protein